MDEKNILESCQARATTDGFLACAVAHDLAQEIGVSPLELGQVVNNASTLRFYRCQLGLFGYGKKSEGTHRIIVPAAYIPPDLRQAILDELVDGRISCLSIWHIADRFVYPRLQVANIVEAMQISIKPCQLGCF